MLWQRRKGIGILRGQAVDLANIAEKKQRIMETGFRLFSEKGIEPVSMPEIAAACGIPRASLYRYYATKTDLVIAIGAAQWMKYISARNASMPRKQIDRMSAAEYFRWYMDSFLDLYRNHSDILRFNYFFNSYIRGAKTTEEQMLPYTNVIEDLKKSFHGMYEKGIRDGTIKSGISEESMLAMSFHIMLSTVTRYAIGLVYNKPEQGLDMEEELERLKEMMIREFTMEKAGEAASAD